MNQIDFQKVIDELVDIKLQIRLLDQKYESVLAQVLPKSDSQSESRRQRQPRIVPTNSTVTTTTASPRRRRSMSPEARARISEAQNKRWAKYHTDRENQHTVGQPAETVTAPSAAAPISAHAAMSASASASASAGTEGE